MDFQGKTALVTGGARRLGKAIALALARRGAGVVVHHRTSAAEAAAFVEELRKIGAGAWAVQADLALPEAAAGLVSRAADASGTSIDWLVNNASIFTESRVDSFSPEDLAANIGINALAPALIARSFAAQGRAGAIVNLLDARMTDYDGGHAAYHLSKRMLASLTSMMAVAYAPRIRVNAVAPGLILPPQGKDAAYLADLAHTNPLNAHGDPEDVAQAAVFLLESRFITGQVLYVDGGRHLRGRMYE
ncbi:MAG TPA: SDR family oxidoreductase [Candidatus Hydrogenedentes bacterium]|nr:SDR family oxidoreductase [Candidatus Hydrogenedentota bacterium]